MKLSAWISVSDLTNVKKTFFERTIINKLVDDTQIMFRSESTEVIFKSLKDAGVDGIELLVNLLTSNENISEVKKIIHKNNMSIFSVHQSLNSFRYILLSEIKRLCSIANIFTSKIVVLHAESLGTRLLDKDFIFILKDLQKRHNITFGIENTPKTPWSYLKPYFFKSKEFTNLINQSGLSITFDTAHLSQAGEDIQEFYLANKGKIVEIHLSDYKAHWLNRKLLLHAYYNHLPLTKGQLPIYGFLNTLKKTRYNGLITMEIFSDLNGICESARLIRRYLG